MQYGNFDFQRILATIQAVPGDEGFGVRLGVSEGGWHAAESMVLARCFMFTQVYFHKTRVAFDIHLEEALKEMLPNGIFSPPKGSGLVDYLQWDDWRVLGKLAEGNGGEHGVRI